jgi:integrase
MWAAFDLGSTMTRTGASHAHTVTPASTRSGLQAGAAVAPSAMTLEAFLVVHIRNHVNQLTVAIKAEQTSMIRRFFVPLYPYALADITPLMVESWFHEIGEQSQSQANKSLGMLRTMFGRARDWRVFTGENPAQHVRKYTRPSRTRFVQPAEMPRLMAVLQGEREDIQCFFLLCLLVGCRRSEGLTLKWTDLDIAGALWHKSKTKTGFAHTIPIPLSLLERLDALPRINEWVFATQQGHWCRSMASERWTVIRKAAGLDDVTIHDLRRTCASWLCVQGTNLAVIGRGVLNHTNLSNTAIYTRLNTAPVARALEENSVRMLPTAPAAPSVAMRPPQQTSKAEWEEWPG